MANQKFIHLLLPFLFLLIAVESTIAFQIIPEPQIRLEKRTDVVVEGLVLCQSCDKYGTWSLDEAKPIKSTTVSVNCRDQRNRVTHYRSRQTDENGYIYAELKDFEPSDSFSDHPLHACKVKLVASPLWTSSFPTNVNYEMSGAQLRSDNKRIAASNYEADVVYAAGPLSFCPEPCAVKAENDI